MSDTNLSNLTVLERQIIPSPWGQSQPNNEQIMLGTKSTLDATRGQITGVAVTAVTLDTQTVFPMGRPKAILIIAAGTVTFANGVPTARLFAARTPKNFGQQAGSLVSGYADAGFLGPTVPLLSAAGTTLPNTGLWITPSSAAGAATGIPDLQWETAHVGLEIVFPGAPTQGTLAIVMYVSPN